MMNDKEQFLGGGGELGYANNINLEREWCCPAAVLILVGIRQMAKSNKQISIIIISMPCYIKIIERPGMIVSFSSLYLYDPPL